MFFIHRGRRLLAVVSCIAVAASLLVVVAPARGALAKGTGPLGHLLELATDVRGTAPTYVTQQDPMAAGDEATKQELGVFLSYTVTDAHGSYLAYVAHPNDEGMVERLGIVEQDGGGLRLTTWQLAERGSWDSPVAMPSTNVANGEILGMDPNMIACELAVAYVIAPTPLDTVPLLGQALEFFVGAVTCWVIMNLPPARNGVWWVDHMRGTEPPPAVRPANSLFYAIAPYHTSSEAWCSNLQDYAGQAYVGGNGGEEPCLVQREQFNPTSGWKANLVFSKGRIMWPDGLLSYENFATSMWRATNPYFNSNNLREMRLGTGSYLITISATTWARYMYDGGPRLNIENQEGATTWKIVMT